jgi:hypothetical protein
MLRNLKELRILSLNILGLDIGKKGLEIISENLKQLVKLVSLRIDISYGKKEETAHIGIETFIKALSHLTLLKKLKLSLIHIYNAHDFGFLTQILGQFKYLESLSLNVRAGPISHQHIAINSLKKLNKLSKLKLNFHKNKFTSGEKFKVFSEVIGGLTLKNLKLNLYDNHLKKEDILDLIGRVKAAKFCAFKLILGKNCQFSKKEIEEVYDKTKGIITLNE